MFNHHTLPKFKIYQQIIITFILVVMVPMITVSVIIYNVNQRALKKELFTFTEHTAEALYKDFQTEMRWQQKQAKTLSLMLKQEFIEDSDINASGKKMFSLFPAEEAFGLYNEEGLLIATTYKNFSALSPELRLPEELTLDHLNNPYEVLYFNAGDPKDSPYYLRSVLPYKNGFQFDEAPIKKTDSDIDLDVKYFVQLKRFNHLKTLVGSNQSLYENLYIIDHNGYIIAGSGSDASTKKMISSEDFAFFRDLQEGVTKEFTTKGHTLPENNIEDDEDTPPLQKVFVKMPDINWGIVIESPYHVRQKYIKRANIQTILLFLASFTFTILLAMIYVYGISRNFRQLIKGITAMADGNYTRRIRLITNFVTPYEIVYLTGEFNRMARKTADAWKTIQEKNEQLSKIDEVKSNLIDTVSHELRTPLTNIKGYTSRLIRYDTTLDSETRMKSLKVVKKQADRLSRMVEDLLVIPDLENAQLRVFPDQVHLDSTISQSAQFTQAKEQRPIRVHYAGHNPAEPVDIMVLADQDRLEQILLNLLDNAVKYSPQGSAIEVNVSPNPTHSHYNISVRNESDPIPKEELNQLFDKFKRVDDSTIRTTRGSGLGLFITKGLVIAMGGDIGLDYNDGYFSITFSVPNYADDQDTPTTPEEKQPVEV